MREYRFELRLCAALEARRRAIVARQIGGGVTRPGNRIVDILLVTPGPEFDDRAGITPVTIPPAAIHAPVGPGAARPWPPGDEWHPETAERIREQAVAAQLFEHERRDGTDYIRQTTRYPDWIGALTAIENKPDLGSPGALARQLRHDVALGVVDRVIVATETHVTGAHLNRLPDAVGVWEVDPEAPPDKAIDVVHEPAQLAAADWGIELLDHYDRRVDVAPVGPDAKRRARVRMAERAYGKGWRTFDAPACEQARPVSTAGTTVPGCAWYDDLIDPSGCGPTCPGYRAGSAPDFHTDSERERRTPWEPRPAGPATRQAGLEEFSEPGPH